ncbi:JAB domain-containing protein [Sphingomonas jaspsi]|uniref:JAB domain-containing protein n=1 Tax=Sphingomonas jaspsi TaxID=392409 RepID=UPI0009FECA6D|nr:JAB domain-containing protein [Sphingomonas jaspsi]
MGAIFDRGRQKSIFATLQHIGWRVGVDSVWSPKHLIDFVSSSFYKDYPGVYCCYLNDRSELLKIELMAVGSFDRIPFKDFLLARRAQKFGASAIVLGYSDPGGAPLASTEISKLKTLARNLEEFDLTLIELVRVSGNGLERHRLV